MVCYSHALRLGVEGALEGRLPRFPVARGAGQRSPTLAGEELGEGESRTAECCLCPSRLPIYRTLQVCEMWPRDLGERPVIYCRMS